jgi:arylsulfatase A-like enzyme
MSVKRPNILLVTADQFRGDCLHCDGNKLINTPNYDNLAMDGMRFKRAYTPNPICVPGRASIITGNYSHKCTGSKNNSGAIHDDQIKLPQLLAENGYETYASGKLHYLPYTHPGKPDTLNGFQHAALAESGRILRLFDPKAELSGVEAYVDYLKTVGWGGYSRGHGIGNNDIHPAASPLPEEHHVDAWVATQALDYLEYHKENHKNKAFFLNVGFPKPHSPYDPPHPWDTMYDPREMPMPFINRDGKGRNPYGYFNAVTHGIPYFSPETIQNIRSHYYGLISFQDKQFGRLVKYLKDNDLYVNTIIIFIADHGDMLGDFGWFFKCVMNEGSCRIPFIVSYPNGIKNNQASDEFVGLQDILPTVASLVGIELGKDVDGIDLTSLLQNKTFSGRDYIISYSRESPYQTYMVRSDCWKYIYTEANATEELYDMNNDPTEEWNLIDKVEMKTTIDEHRKNMINWAKKNGDSAIFDNGKLLATEVDTLKFDFTANSMGWRWY